VDGVVSGAKSARTPRMCVEVTVHQETSGPICRQDREKSIQWGPPMSTAPGGGSVGVGANCRRWWAISSVLTVLVLVVSVSAQCVFNCASDPPQVRAHAVCVCCVCVMNVWPPHPFHGGCVSKCVHA
jgi:hypothetical protein